MPSLSNPCRGVPARIGRRLVPAAALALMASACGGGEAPGDAASAEGDPGLPEISVATSTGGLGQDSVTVTGLWSALPGGAVLTPCGSDAVWTLAGAAPEVERRVRLERPDASGPVPVTLVGRRGPADALAVDSVVAVHGEDACPGTEVDRALEGTAWQLSSLAALEGAREPEVVGVGAWLRLVEDEGRLEGFTGCLPLAGRFQREVTRLRFHALEPAPGACPGVDVHRAFLDALAGTGSYRVRGGRLELLDEGGAVATFRAPDVRPGGG